MYTLKRRNFLKFSLSSAGAFILSQCANISQQHSVASSSLLSAKSSLDGLLAIDLKASLTSVNLGRKKAYLMTYNGQFPGPTLEAKPGDTIRINFTNNLSQPTNLHYHGLHIPPTGKADNVFLDIPPQTSFTYEFTIPKNHRGGTFWYHPHLHGYTAEQVFSGLVGVLIIRGELDEIPEIKAAQEDLLVFHDFDLEQNGYLLSPTYHQQMMGREGELITVNNQIQPTLKIESGGLLRWRLINTSASRFYRLSLENHLLYLIATDGGAISQPVELEELLLTPGQRAEVLIKGEQKAGEYRLLSLPYDRGSIGMGMGMGRMGRMGTYSQVTETLAKLVYQGSISPLSLPQKLIPVQALPEAKIVRRIELSMGMIPGEGMVFLFNGKTFDHQRIDAQVKLNTVEDWELVNLDSHQMEHPFHLHINPFQVISRNGQTEPLLAWKDTVLIPSGETVRIRVKFADFTGKTVYHCHILDHEDLGMMGVVNIS
jgi:FtsP/CotA-like multicopper oxidase with cupredoxin domain